MGNKKLFFLNLILIAFFFVHLMTASAETIILKSGKQVEGPIIEKSDKYIKIDIVGVPVTYYIDEIEKIGNDNVVAGKDAASELFLKKKEFEKRLSEVKGLFQNNEYKSVIVKLNQMKELYPDEPLLYKACAFAYYYMGSFKEAIDSFNEAIKIKHGEKPNDYLAIWAAYDASGDYKNARENMLKALDTSQREEKFQEFLIIERLLKKIYGKN